MSSHRVYRQRRYEFGQRLFDLRTRLALTQGQLAEEIGVHWHSVQKWETGESYPKAETLQRLIAVCLHHQAFTAANEREEAESLWQQVSDDGQRRLASFDQAWFDHTLALTTNSLAPSAEPSTQATDDETLLSSRPATPATPLPATSRAIIDLGEVIAVPQLLGREPELATLQQWVIADRCRVVTLVGLGGIGKSSLTLIFAQRVLAEFEVVLFRSLQNGPPLAAVLDHTILTVSNQQAIPPESITDKIALLVQLLRERRCLLILDNFESLMQPGELTGTYRTGYAEYGTLLQALSEREHYSCLMLTSREKPSELGRWESRQGPVRTLLLTGLADEACRYILALKDIVASPEDVHTLRHLYGGNPLALNLVSAPIRDLFGGDVATFLATDYAYFDGVHKLMGQHFARLTPLERTIVYWFAVQRELMSLDVLVARLGPTVPGREVLIALESLIHRGQVERGADSPTFTLQPMILEFVTEQLVDTLCQEIDQIQPRLLNSHALIQATAKDYVRQRQEQLVGAQLLEQSVALCGGSEAVEQRLIALLDFWRAHPQLEQGYGPGNAVNLLRLLRGHLRGLDLTGLALRGAYLQGVEMQDTRLTGAALLDSVVSEALGIVHTVASTHSGSYWAASSINGAVYVWRNHGQSTHLSIPAHRRAVMALTFSPDETILASGSWDCTVKLWDMRDGVLVSTLEGHTDYVQSIAFSPDGKQLATGSDDQTLRIWDMASGACLRTIHAHTDNTYGAAWSPDGQSIASCGFDCLVRVWDVTSGDCLKTLAGHTRPVTKVAFSPDGRLLASASFDHTVRVWEVASGDCVQILAEHTSTVITLAWSPARKGHPQTLASAGFDGTIRLWRADQNKSQRVLLGHGASVYSIAFTSGGAMLLSGSDDQTIRVWDVANGWCVRVIKVYGLFFFGVVWSPDGRALLSANSDTTLTVWNVADGTVRLTLRGHTSAVFAVAWSPDGRWLASGGFDHLVHIWDATTGVCIRMIQAHADLVYRLVWSPDGQWLASTGRDQTVRVWDIHSGVCRWIARGHASPINEVVWSPDGQQVASCSEDHTVCVWRAEDGSLLHTLAGHETAVAGVAWSPDGRLLASAGGGGATGELLVWDAAHGELLQAFSGLTSVVYKVAWSKDSKTLLGGTSNGSIHWWDVTTGAEIAQHQSHLGWVRSLSVSPDGSLLLSSGEDGVIHVWEIERAACIRTLRLDRPYERMDIRHLTGISETQRAALVALGAVA